LTDDCFYTSDSSEMVISGNKGMYQRLLTRIKDGLGEISNIPVVVASHKYVH